MEEQDLFFKDVAERRQSTLLGSMEDNEKEKEKRSTSPFKKENVNECCKAYWSQRFPVLSWITTYSCSFLVSDLVAGITVGLTAIPQGVAYAVVAGLEPQYGLYSGFMGGFVYFLLGTVKEITIGPTAIMALMVQNYVEKYNSDFAVLSCFLTGCTILLLGILQLGFLVNFIALPVIVGFTTAAALTIAASQFKSLLGIPGKTHQFLGALISTFQDIRKTKVEDLVLGLLTIAFLVGMKALHAKISKRHGNTVSINSRTRFLLGSIKFISLAKNGIAVIFGTVLAYLFSIYGLVPFRLTGEVGHGFPEFRPPPFSTNVKINNETVHLSFENMAKIMSTSIISTPLLSILETIAIGKIFVKGNPLNATQEMIALGVSNILGSFVRSMPTAGSFTRSVVNSASGVKTPLVGIIIGITVLSALALTATFKYIPKASLAAVIITAMFYMIDYHEFVFIWRVNKLDMIPLCMTIVFSLTTELSIGILVGICTNFLLIVYINLKPKVTREELTVLGEEIVLFHLAQSPIYPGAEYVRNSIMKYLKFKKKALVVIDGRNMLNSDSTTVRALKVLAEYLEKHHQEYVLWNWPPESKEQLSRVSEEVTKHFYDTQTLENLVEVTSSKNSTEEY